MRQSIALCLMLGMALTACSKKNAERETSEPPAVTSQQAAPQQSVASPNVAQQQAAPATTQAQPTSPASIAQPLRKETIIVTQKYACKNDTTFTARFMHNPAPG